MGIRDRLQAHESKINKESNDYTLRHVQKSGNLEGHRSMTSHFNVINKCGQKVSKKVDVDYDKQIDSFKNPYNKNEETGTVRN